MQNQTPDIKNYQQNVIINQNGQVQYYSANPVEVPPNAPILSPHLAQVINEQYLNPQHPANNHNQSLQYNNNNNNFQNVPNPQSTPSIDLRSSSDIRTTNSQDDDEAYQTEFGDELSFLVENFQLKEQKQTFMPYIY